jgi:ABC-type transport system involved in cytochrome c biogenesis permease subunit
MRWEAAMLARTLELSWGAQVVGCAVYAYGLLGRKGGGAQAARGLLIAAWALGAVALGTRWHASGLTQPPWLGLSETMVFGSWLLLGLQLLGELRRGARTTGFFCLAFSAAVFGTVIFKLNGFGPVMPAHAAFQRPWLWIHLPLGAAGFGLLLLAAFYGIAGLVRSGVTDQKVLSALGAVTLLSLCRVFPLDWPTQVAFAGFAAFLVLCALGFWFENLDARLVAEREMSGAKSGKLPARRAWWRGTRWAFGASWLGLLAVLWRMDGGRVPYLFIWLAFLAVMGAGALLLTARRKAIEERLPELESLDDSASQAALQAFPWLTFHLVSGSIWAYEVWGSYWSGIPATAWAAWFYLAMLLHLRPGKISTAAARALAVFWVMAAIAAGGVHGFWPVRF